MTGNFKKFIVPPKPQWQTSLKDVHLQMKLFLAKSSWAGNIAKLIISEGTCTLLIINKGLLFSQRLSKETNTATCTDFHLINPD